MRKIGTILAGACAFALGGGALWAQQGGGEAATAVYWMTADTMSGMGGMMGQSRGAMLGQLMRGRGMGGGTARTLRLQLGSTRRAAGAPAAEHLPPPGLQAGQSLPLVTPQAARPEPASPGDWSGKMERPKGRILIYWGCGEHARPGQPAVIDFESLSQGRMPPAFANLNAVRGARTFSPERFATYGEWPNQRSSTNIPAGASLIGEHVVRGNYTPDIRFSVAPGQDFLAPVTLTSQSAAASGAVPLAWQPIANARGWVATVMGAAGGGDMVIWTSSDTQAMAMGMDHMSDADIARLVQQRVLLPGTADRCTIPAEVARGAQGTMLTLIAFGGEHVFSNPVRPARAAAGWRPDWLVRLRIKSMYMGILGMEMPDMGGGAQGGDPSQPQQKKKKKSIFDKALGGMIPH
jgi:hypothetical protein